MSNTRKLVSLLLAVVLTLGLTALGYAEGETGSITINDAVVGQTYTIYQILDLESYNASANAYAYKATTAWNNFINSDAIKGTYVQVDAQGYVTWKTGADAVAFAKAAQKYAKDNSITNQGSVTATTTTVSFTGLDLGYYLVDTTLGTLCSLDTTNPNVVMEEKNEVPTNVKTVEEDSDNKYGETNDADIDVAWVPGAFELPIVAKKMAESGKYDAVICLGAVIRGSTTHYDYVCNEASKGIAQVGMQTGVPTIFSVVTTENIEQAIERAGTKAGNKGADGAMSAMEMANLLKKLG